jgi:hypothetical protein
LAGLLNSSSPLATEMLFLDGITLDLERILEVMFGSTNRERERDDWTRKNDKLFTAFSKKNKL